MKTKLTLIIAFAAVVAGMVSCGEVSYKKLKTGIMYKIFPGGSKDSAAGTNNVVKFNIIQKFNDSLLYSSHGRMAAYLQLNSAREVEYNPWDVLYYMKKGDSAVIVEFFDTLIKKGLAQQLPFAGKKGDRITSYIKVIEVYRKDSIARADYNAEMLRDKPRQEKEAQEMEAKQEAGRIQQRAAELEEYKKSGEAEKEDKEMQTYLATNKITNAKSVAGTYVVINDKGTGEPALTGKYVTVKYTGVGLANKKQFDAGVYIFKPGSATVIQGWDDGIPQFNKGGKGVLYVPGYRGYGKKAGPGGTPFEAMIFDVEIVNVSDTREKADADKRVADSIATAMNVKPVK